MVLFLNFINPNFVPELGYKKNSSWQDLIDKLRKQMKNKQNLTVKEVASLYLRDLQVEHRFALRCPAP
jgi:hypothetical protein